MSPHVALEAIGWCARAHGAQVAHWYALLPPGGLVHAVLKPWSALKPRCGAGGVVSTRFMDPIGYYAHSELVVPCCRRCVRLLAGDLMRAGRSGTALMERR